MNSELDNKSKGQSVADPDGNEFVNSEIIDKDVALFVSEMIKARERLGVSQVKLAALTGIKQSAISRMESYRVPPQLDTVMRILNALGLKLSVTSLPFKNRKEQDIMNIKMGSVNKVHAEVVYCNLDIQKSDDDNFHFLTEHGDEFSVEVNSINALIVKQKEHKNVDDIFKEPIKATLKIPQGYNGDAFFCGRTEKDFSNNLGADKRGKIKVSDLVFKNIVMCNFHTDLECENLFCDTLKTETKHANAVYKQVKGNRILEFETRHSEVSIQNAKAVSLLLRANHSSCEFVDSVGDEMEVSSNHSELSLKRLTLEGWLTSYLHHSNTVQENIVAECGMEITSHHSNTANEQITTKKIKMLAHHSNFSMDSVISEGIDCSLRHSNVELKNAKIYSIEARCEHSNLDLRLAGKKEDYNINVSVSFAKANIAGTTYGDKAVYANEVANASKKLAITANFGDVTVNFMDKD